MALFVRNCKLVLLLRKEFSEGEENIFRPAEWRWKLPQVCDNEWHHYAINVNFPKVELVVDGDKWSAEKDNPEIIDDWPLHPVAGITTRTSVGACWQGAEEDFKHELTGYLAGLSILRGSNENTEVLRCLHQCAESLQVPASSSLPAGMEMVTDKRGSRVIVDGPDSKDITKLMEQVAYLNTREFPAPGKRIVNLSTKLTCEDGHVMHLREQKSFVNVIEVPEPKIDIKGTADIKREYDDFKLGVRIFADVHILMTTGSAGNGKPTSTNPLIECHIIHPSFLSYCRRTG